MQKYLIIKLKGSDSLPTSKSNSYFTYHTICNVSSWYLTLWSGTAKLKKTKFIFPPHLTLGMSMETKISIPTYYTLLIEVEISHREIFQVFISRSLHQWVINTAVYCSAPDYYPPTLISIVIHSKITWTQREHQIKFLSLYATVLVFVFSQEKHLTMFDNITCKKKRQRLLILTKNLKATVMHLSLRLNLEKKKSER